MQQLMFRSPQTNRSLCSYPAQWRQDVEIEIEATVDMIKDGKKTRTVQIQLMIVVGSTTRLFDVARIPVEIRDAKSVGMCKSINDPHITTFDKRKYDNFFEGEFVMYRHKTLPYAVHTFYRSCNKRASCNCAVAVRSGDDVIVLDVCGQTRSTGKKKRRPLTKKLFLNGELTPGTSVFQQRKGKKYEVMAFTFLQISNLLLNTSLP
ncbi:von Willebrand factor D and EGF domain-containing protein-like [Crassostrea virginica]